VFVRANRKGKSLSGKRELLPKEENPVSGVDEDN
jgi:hypothetical protein